MHRLGADGGVAGAVGGSGRSAAIVTRHLSREKRSCRRGEWRLGNERGGLATRDTAQRGEAATQVAACILPAVELGFQPGGRNAPHAANHWEFSSNCPSTPRFRAAGCRPLRQPGWLPLRNSRDPRRFRPILIDSAVCATVANVAVVAQTAL